MTTSSGISIILVDSDGFVWTGQDFKWPSEDVQPVIFSSEDALKTAFSLEKDLSDLSDENIELHIYEPSTGDSRRFLCTSTAVAWPRAEAAFRRHTGIDLDREQFLQWRDTP